MDKLQRFSITLYLDFTKSFPYHTEFRRGRSGVVLLIFCPASSCSPLVHDPEQTLL